MEGRRHGDLRSARKIRGSRGHCAIPMMVKDYYVMLQISR